MILLLALSGAVAWYLNQWKPGEEPETDVEAAVSEESAPMKTVRLVHYGYPPRNLEELVERYAKAQGGPEKIAQIKSLKLRGVTRQGDQEMEFQQIKRVPSSSRITLETAQYELSTITNGDEVWRKFGGRPEVYRVTGEDRERVLSESQIISPLWTYRNTPGVLSMMSDEMLDGVIYHRVKVAIPDQPVAVYWIDPETYLERQIVTTNAEGGEVVTLFEDYRPLDWLVIPYRVVFMKDGELVSDIELMTADMNIGVFASYFDPPEMTAEWPPKGFN
ncbi:hypothetical protein [Cerasicoccus maritimus]|uniref:hypothetical protein n=1 Tax=Cerasicoccus maritimus TaxID=490089 RepID=UPI0028529560|nr:hypothetical protein [Cerasicoccus maritimus]